MASFARGQRLGPYETLEVIGAGGMGEVWKARDTHLGRIVAIKISKEQFSERFEGETRAVAALNHPHICTLHDVGPSYVVMEFVEGAPLKGPLPIDKAVEYAGQILEALDAAHRKGITHRDLKPANIPGHQTGDQASHPPGCGSFSKAWVSSSPRNRPTTQRLSLFTSTATLSRCSAT